MCSRMDLYDRLSASQADLELIQRSETHLLIRGSLNEEISCSGSEELSEGI